MCNPDNMEMRKRKEQREYQERLSEAVSRDHRVNVLPDLFVVHDPNITAGDLDTSISYLTSLLGKASRLHSQILHLNGSARDAALQSYYHALSDARNFSIHCLELSGELLERGIFDVTNPQIVHIARYFCDIQDFMPNITPTAMAALRCVDLIDKNDPFETARFRSEAVGSICSLATIPSGKLLLKTLFDLRYYDPKLDQTRRDANGDYLPATVRVRNVFTDKSLNMEPTADTTERMSAEGRISADAQPRILPGAFRRDAYIFPHVVEYNKLMQSMLTIVPPANRSDRCLLQHLAQIDMGHELIHTVHISYGVALNMLSSSLSLEERVTAGDVFGSLNPIFASATTRADSAAFDHADDSFKEAYLVSEQSLRRDFGTVLRHSYNQKLDIDATGDGLKEDERLVFLFTDELIHNFEDNSFLDYVCFHNPFSELFASIRELPFEKGREMNVLINKYLRMLEKNKKAIIDSVFDKVCSNMIGRQYGDDDRTPRQNKREVFIRKRLYELVNSNRSLFFGTIMELMKTRIKNDLLFRVLNEQLVASTRTSSTSSDASPAASAAAVASSTSHFDDDDDDTE